MMITDGKKYLNVKDLSALLRGVISKHNGDFHCLNSFHSFRTGNKLKSHENVHKSHYYCNVKMPEKARMRVPFDIYAGTEFLLEKIDTCHNN